MACRHLAVLILATLLTPQATAKDTGMYTVTVDEYLEQIRERAEAWVASSPKKCRDALTPGVKVPTMVSPVKNRFNPDWVAWTVQYKGEPSHIAVYVGYLVTVPAEYVIAALIHEYAHATDRREFDLDIEDSLARAIAIRSLREKHALEIQALCGASVDDLAN